jgi:hypothetical protein
MPTYARSVADGNRHGQPPRPPDRDVRDLPNQVAALVGRLRMHGRDDGRVLIGRGRSRVDRIGAPRLSHFGGGSI